MTDDTKDSATESADSAIDEVLDAARAPAGEADRLGLLDLMRAEHESVFGDDACSAWARESIDRYVSGGVPPGDCLQAALANDLVEFVSRADVETGRRAAAIAGYIYRHVSRDKRGNRERVDAWIKQGMVNR